MNRKIIDHLISNQQGEGLFGLPRDKTVCGISYGLGSNLMKGCFAEWVEPNHNSSRCSKCLKRVREDNKSEVPFMSTAIVGSRTIPHENKLLLQLEDIFKSYFKDSLEIVSGGAKGADYLGKALAKDLDGVGYKEFPADWDNLGRAAGVIRNTPISERVHNFLIITYGPEVKPGSGTADVLSKFDSLGKSGLHVAYVEGGLKIVGLWRPHMKRYGDGYLKFIN